MQSATAVGGNSPMGKWKKPPKRNGDGDLDVDDLVDHMDEDDSAPASFGQLGTENTHIGTGGSVLTDPTNVVEYPLGEKERPTPKLRTLPVRRSRATKEEADKVRLALDLSVLQILPPHITDQLTPRQEEWLVARLMAGSDDQTTKNLGISRRVVYGWRVNDESFAKAYELVVLDKVNFALILNRLLYTKVALQQWNQLDHPNLAVRMATQRDVSKVQIAAMQIAAKNSSVDLVKAGASAMAGGFEFLRRTLADGGLMDLVQKPDSGQLRLPDGEVSGRVVDGRAAAVVDILDSIEWSTGSGEILQDPGQE